VVGRRKVSLYLWRDTKQDVVASEDRGMAKAARGEIEDDPLAGRRFDQAGLLCAPLPVGYAAHCIKCHRADPACEIVFDAIHRRAGKDVCRPRIRNRPPAAANGQAEGQRTGARSIRRRRARGRSRKTMTFRWCRARSNQMNCLVKGFFPETVNSIFAVALVCHGMRSLSALFRHVRLDDCPARGCPRPAMCQSASVICVRLAKVIKACA